MEPSDKVKNYYSIFLEIVQSNRDSGEKIEDLDLFYLGYKKGAAVADKPAPEDPKELERLAFRAVTSAPFPALLGRAREFYLIGSGFFLALRRTNMISSSQLKQLKSKLERELREEFFQQSEKLYSLFFRSDNSQLDIVRKKAVLVKTLREQNAPFWKKVHSALYEPEKYSEKELGDILIKTIEFLEKNGLLLQL